MQLQTPGKVWQRLLLIPFQLFSVEKIQSFGPFKGVCFVENLLGCVMLSLRHLTAAAAAAAVAAAVAAVAL